MADSTKYIPIGGTGTTLNSHLNTLFPILKARKTLTVAYCFTFAFVALTVFLAFCPSPNTSSPFFTSIFSSTATTASSASSYKSQLSSIFSFFFPNTTISSSATLHTDTTRSSNSTSQSPQTSKKTFKTTPFENQTQTTPPTRSKIPSDHHTAKPPDHVVNKEPSSGNNHTQVSDEDKAVKKTNQSSNGVGHSPNKNLSSLVNGGGTEKGVGHNLAIGNILFFILMLVSCYDDLQSCFVNVSLDYNFSVELFVSPFLVQEWEVQVKNGTKKETLRLDLVGKSSVQYKNADIIIFNTGHWWTHDKTSKGKDYYQEGSHVYDELNVLEAFRRAITTWSRWIDANINQSKSMVFFRGYSASHFSGGQWNSGGQCDSETVPIKNEKYLREYPPKMRVLEKVLKNMKAHVTYLNVTKMTDFRKDGHPSIYRKQNLSPEERKSPLRYQDCSHWCLPGVPDAWNEILYAELLLKQYQNQQKRP
ncbi:hypothetical protein JHK85_004628 [Glycine max]|nr:hypothetical protein JHK85_004628 [Glycine max]